ncbi:MAG: 50S ribosomal protein L3 [Verrucomicrobia bacterium]|nr:50S ribosomal protein L3 [Verrucomicrobiota bacterium]
MNGLIGKKLGMTQIFDDQGNQVPVTAIETGPCVVVQVKTTGRDGYDSVQLGFIEQKEQRLTKAVAGHFKKAGAAAKKVLREFRADADEEFEPGQQLDVGLFEGVSHVDVVATSKGSGFQGVVRRHGMSGGRASHGSHMHRRTGSIGQCEFPARVFKGKRMPGQYGNVRVTTQNLKVVRVIPEDNVLLVRGAVPGPVGGIVTVCKAIKKAAAAS